MNRTMTITAAEWASARAGTLWIVGEGLCSLCIEGGNDHESYGVGPCAPNLPPLEFAQACAFCTACDARLWDRGHNRKTDCLDCRIELVGPCLACVSGEHSHEFGHPVTVTLGYAYAVGQPLPIVNFAAWFRGQTHKPERVGVYLKSGHLYVRDGKGSATNITADVLARYHQPESLVGQWALQLAVVL